MTSNGERSRYFGPDGDSPEGYTNLRATSSTSGSRTRGIIDELLAQPPPVGPKPKLLKGVKGYVAGYNRYLRQDRGRQPARPDLRRRSRGCARSPSTTPTGASTSSASSPRARSPRTGSSTPPPPGGAGDAAGAAEVTPGDVAELGAALDAARGDTGSNGWGIGSEATENGSGMVLGNPHFPWQGSERFYQSHLVIPGKLNVSGASLFGVPVINIGHTEQPRLDAHGLDRVPLRARSSSPSCPATRPATWSTASRRRWTSNEVTVQALQPDGSLAPVTRTLYTTRYGPIITSLQGQSLFDWTNTTAYAMYDANADNLRYLNHFFDTNKAQSTNELLDVLKKYEGIPWVNTMASDSRGKALYADIGAIPNVPNAKATGPCQAPLGALTFPAPRAADPRRLALRVRAGDRPRLGRARDLRPLEPAEHVPPRLRRQLERLLLARQPRAAARRASRGSSATRAPSARCASGSG